MLKELCQLGLLSMLPLALLANVEGAGAEEELTVRPRKTHHALSPLS